MHLAWLAVALLFVIDVLTPPGAAVSIGYVVVVAAGLRFPTSRTVLAFAGTAGALAAIAVPFKLGSPATDWRFVVANRALIEASIAAVAMLVIGSRRRAAELVEAERGRARAQTLLQQAMDTTPDGLMLVEPSGTIRAANPAAHKMFAYAPEALVGLSIEALVPAAQRAKHQAQRSERQPTAGAWRMTGGREARAVKQDGTELIIECTLVATGVEDLTLASVHDVTERHRYESRLRSTQRLESIGRLAGGIAHDFNNLLTVVNGSAELLARAALDAQSQEEVEQILEAGRRGAELTRQILAFSRRQVISPRRLDVNAAVKDAQKMFSRVLGEDIQLATLLAPAAWTVEMDPAQLEQVLLNLVVNARDAMPTGGRLTLETANVRLDEAYARTHPEVKPGEYVMLGVSDTGQGMTEEVRVRIFEPFFTTKGVGKGTGLGLATVHGIVMQAGGHVWVYSEPGNGTTFKIYLPRVDGVAEAIAKAPVVRPKGGSERVLVVEDEPAVRRLLVRVLRDAGYEVLEACNGLDAMSKIDAIAGDLSLLITDVVMPQLGGRDLADRIRARRPGIKVLYLSGYTENAIVHHGVLDVGLVFLEKPFRADNLLRRVRELLDTEPTA